MESPTLTGTREVAADTHEIASFMPVADLGIIAINAFLIRGRQPVLVDTGIAALRNDFLAALETLIDPRELRWIWLSHLDADHVGNLEAVLERAPQAEIVTNFLGMAKMSLSGLPTARVRLLDPAARLDAGDRELVPLRPPYYDAPETTGFFDTRTRTLFAADAFGALLPAPANDAREIETGTLREGIAAWTAIDAPWLGLVDRNAMGRVLDAIGRADPTVILSAHLPAARGMTGALLDHVAHACAAATASAQAVTPLEHIEELTREAA